MKHILSTTGEKIHFALTGTRKLVIDSVVPVQVSDEEYTILHARLGSQIKAVSTETETPATTETPSTPEEKKEEATDVTPPTDETTTEDSTDEEEEEVDETEAGAGEGTGAKVD